MIGRLESVPESSPLRVLLVDKCEDVAAHARRLLAAHQRPAIELVHCNDVTQAEQLVQGDRGAFDVVMHGMRDLGPRYRRHLRNMVVALAPRPLIVTGEGFDDDEIEMLVELGVRSVLPRSAWTDTSLAHTLLMSVAVGRRQQLIGYDPLTGLPTRGLWGDRLRQVLERCRSCERPCAVMLVDVDDFKIINDTLGHEVGDIYLREIAERLRSAIRHDDLVARLGGDEFGLLIHDLPGLEAASVVARKIIEHIGRPMAIARSLLSVSISVGVAVISPRQRRISSDWVYRAADTALYQAKRAGKNRFSVYTADMDRELRENHKIENDLSQAAMRGQFQLHYQPIFNVREQGLHGFEALLRWDCGGRRRLSPSLFVPVLERLGLMDDLGVAIFEEALAQLVRWRQISGRPLVMHVNMSGVQLIQHGLGGVLDELLGARGLPPSAVVLELSEALLLRHGAALRRELFDLRARGLRVAIDHFGSLQNGFLSLRQMLPDMIKIDRELVHCLEESRLDGAIVHAQTVLARNLGIEVVAEGIESVRQLDLLRSAAGADMIQGYLTGAPLPAAELERAMPQLHASAEAADAQRSSHLRPLRVAGCAIG